MLDAQQPLDCLWIGKALNGEQNSGWLIPLFKKKAAALHCTRLSIRRCKHWAQTHAVGVLRAVSPHPPKPGLHLLVLLGAVHIPCLLAMASDNVLPKNGLQTAQAHVVCPEGLEPVLGTCRGILTQD